MRRLLMLDDEINVLHALQRTLRQCDFAAELRIEIFTDGQKALDRMANITFDVILSDYQMPNMHGIAFLKRCRALQPDAVRLILSASTEFETVRRAINEAEIFRFIPKPWQFAELHDVIGQSLARRRDADRVAVQTGHLTAQEIALRSLEAAEPGITHVNWGPDGSVLLD